MRCKACDRMIEVSFWKPSGVGMDDKPPILEDLCFTCLCWAHGRTVTNDGLPILMEVDPSLIGREKDEEVDAGS